MHYKHFLLVFLSLNLLCKHTVRANKILTKTQPRTMVIDSINSIHENHKPLDSTDMNFDQKMILLCIDLSQKALDKGDLPFGSVITKNGKIIAQASNDKNTKTNYHAEILALNRATDSLGTTDLSECTLYTNCEPCPMCSFMIREHKVKKVVFALPSPFMGGHSKWNILADTELSHFSPFFASPPKVIGPILEKEAKAIFDKTPLWMFGTHAREDKRFMVD